MESRLYLGDLEPHMELLRNLQVGLGKSHERKDEVLARKEASTPASAPSSV